MPPLFYAFREGLIGIIYYERIITLLVRANVQVDRFVIKSWSKEIRKPKTEMKGDTPKKDRRK